MVKLSEKFLLSLLLSQQKRKHQKRRKKPEIDNIINIFIYVSSGGWNVQIMPFMSFLLSAFPSNILHKWIRFILLSKFISLFAFSAKALLGSKRFWDCLWFKLLAHNNFSELDFGRSKFYWICEFFENWSCISIGLKVVGHLNPRNKA